MRRPRSSLTALSIVAAIAMAIAAPALSADQPKSPPEARAKPAKETKPKEQLVCETQDVAGSIIPKRVCRTQKQIDAERQAVEDLNRERRELGGTSFGDRGITPSGTLNGH